VGTALAAYFAVVMGVFGGLKNLALFVFGGPSLVDVLASFRIVPETAVSHYLIAPFGGLVGLGVARVRHGQLPWREVIAVVAAAVVVGLLEQRVIADGVRLVEG